MAVTVALPGSGNFSLVQSGSASSSRSACRLKFSTPQVRGETPVNVCPRSYRSRVVEGGANGGGLEVLGDWEAEASSAE